MAREVVGRLQDERVRGRNRPRLARGTPRVNEAPEPVRPRGAHPALDRCRAHAYRVAAEGIYLFIRMKGFI